MSSQVDELPDRGTHTGGTHISEALAAGARLAARLSRPLRARVGWVAPLGWSIMVGGLVAWWVGARYGWAELTMLAAAAFVLLAACIILAVGRTRGFKVAQCTELAGWICDILDHLGDADIEADVASQVTALCKDFPVYR